VWGGVGGGSIGAVEVEQCPLIGVW